MALRTLVKISSVNNLSVARYGAGMGVDLMGFDLDESSKGYVSPENFMAITGWLSGVKFVGELPSLNPDLLPHIVDSYALDYLQINASASLDLPDKLPLPLILKIDKSNISNCQTIFKDYRALVRWFLIETESLLAPENLNWIAGLARNYPIILGNNVTSKNIDELMDSGFSGFAFAGGNEIKPGYKNFDELADVLEALEVQ